MTALSPLDRLQAAIEKLERLRDESTPNPWIRYDDGILVGIERQSAAVVNRTVAEAGELRVADVDLIVTLHRTIDAQLRVLRFGIELIKNKVGYQALPELALADALLGGEQ